MADAIDRANQLAEEARDAALARTLEASNAAPAEDPFCEDCGGLIPVVRRERLPSATRCVGCQSVHERKSAHYVQR
ncbi:TraR/DksA C4-type zinc finger protein [Algiphilus sp.]|uniref:TraR/DksA C4-type zinc finger protein n=1 Tax=Algiphilus sp. TaxID=1872431 RepID=UPI0025C2CC5A|nr:TraR/DksA C4-type zinc finger protein [Algiphilus sp.]MCK5770918.1 TraR/DksA C4-type zinc finger protein [Algiphilus sp.]